MNDDMLYLFDMNEVDYATKRRLLNWLKEYPTEPLYENMDKQYLAYQNGRHDDYLLFCIDNLDDLRDRGIAFDVIELPYFLGKYMNGYRRSLIAESDRVNDLILKIIEGE